MKFALVTIFAIFAVVSSNDDFVPRTQQDLQSYRQECVQELSIPPNLIEEYKKWSFPEDDLTKCYIKCIFNKMSLFEDDQGPIVDNLLQQLQNNHGDDLESEIEKCVDTNPDKDDNCSWAYRGFICFNKNHIGLIKSSVKIPHTHMG